MGHLFRGQHALERGQVGDVASRELHGGQLVAGHDQLGPPLIRLEVQPDDGVASAP